MIPARLGSQRLKEKNLQLFNGKSLIENAVEKAKSIDTFNEIWVNSESDKFIEITKKHKINFHKRPERLASNTATSEDFVYEFLTHHKCDYVVQLHSIAPLITTQEINHFLNELKRGKCDIFLSVEKVQIECVFKEKPINFNYLSKTNSQELSPVEKISWSITAWNSRKFIESYEQGLCATYSGSIQTVGLSKEANFMIKTKEDLIIAESIFKAKIAKN